MIFSSVTERILKLLDSRLRAFRAEIVTGKLEARLEPNANGSLKSFKKEDPIVNSCYLRPEVGYVPCLQESLPHDWLTVEVFRALREEFLDIIGCVTDRVLSRLEGRASVI